MSEARPRGHGEGHLASVRSTDGDADRGDLVLRLVHDTTHGLEDVAQVVRDRRGRSDGIHRAQFEARGHGTHADRLVAVHDDHFLLDLGRRDLIADAEVLVGPGHAQFHQFDVLLNDGDRLLAEGLGNLRPRAIGVAREHPRQHADHEHVLPVPWIVGEREALRFHGNEDEAVGAIGHLLHGGGPGRTDRLVFVVDPHALDEDQRVVGEGAQPVPRQQHLLVEGHHDPRLIAPVGDLLGSDPDAHAAGAPGSTGRRLDLGGDDLDRPRAVAHLGAHGGEDLAALLRAFSRVRDDLDGLLGQGHELGDTSDPVRGGALLGRRGGAALHDGVSSLSVAGGGSPCGPVRSRPERARPPPRPTAIRGPGCSVRAADSTPRHSNRPGTRQGQILGGPTTLHSETREASGP